jgi:D-aspartate ligase
VNRPPAILAGAGMVTAMPIIRSLGRAGIDIRLLCTPGSPTASSRYAHRLATDGEGAQAEQWRRYLLGPRSDDLRGAVLLACNDDALELFVEHHDALAEK